jgi:hypothetical protein
VAIVVVTFITAGALGASAFRDRNGGHTPTAKPATDSANVAAPPVVIADTTSTISAPSTPAAAVIQPQPKPVVETTAAPVTTAPVTAAPVTAAPVTAAPLTPAIAMGESALELPAGATAVRSDSDVVVSFDQMMARTRRPEKFEDIVRTTLREVYGPSVAAALAKLPVGGIVSQGELLTELPARGVRIPFNAGWIIRLFPETRPGQDGPLVVRYRVRVVPSGG